MITKGIILINDKQNVLGCYNYNFEGFEQMGTKINMLKINKHFDNNESFALNESSYAKSRPRNHLNLNYNEVEPWDYCNNEVEQKSHLTSRKYTKN